MDKVALGKSLARVWGNLTGSHARALTGVAKDKARALGKLKSRMSTMAKKKPWYRTKGKHQKLLGGFKKKVDVAQEEADFARKSLSKAVRDRRLTRGVAAAGGAYGLMKSRKSKGGESSGYDVKYAADKVAFKPISAVKNVMSRIGKAPRPSAGLHHKMMPMLPKTNPAAPVFKSKAPTANKPIIPKPPKAKPPNVTTGGLLRPGKNVVS